MAGWERYLRHLIDSPYSVTRLVTDLVPGKPIVSPQFIEAVKLNYSLWPFQLRVVEKVEGGTLILGLPTGLGKTFLAGAYLKREAEKGPIRVLFLAPTVPLGVQQTLFARRMLTIEDAYFISGEVPPERRLGLRVWNGRFIVSTPQTFFNDALSQFDGSLVEARARGGDIEYLRQALQEASFTFPFNILIADECQRYIGETEGYAVLLVAKASGARVLGLSATPQLHAPDRLRELSAVFERVEVFSLQDPEIKAHVPKRVLRVVRVATPTKLFKVYTTLSRVVGRYRERVGREFGAEHLRSDCREHFQCIWLKALQVLRVRLVEDGASSVLGYGAWKLRELRQPLEELGGRSLSELYREALGEGFNHKINAAVRILDRVRFEKAIVFTESVQAAKQLGRALQERLSLDDVAILVGKGAMGMEQQASALLHFKERAKVLVATSVAEEGLDIPSADIEVWLDPPSNPKKWVQRFGRILRQPGGKEEAVTYALVSMRTHEKSKLLRVLKRTEEVYGFTQEVLFESFTRRLPRAQRTLSQFTEGPSVEA